VESRYLLLYGHLYFLTYIRQTKPIRHVELGSKNLWARSYQRDGHSINEEGAVHAFDCMYAQVRSGDRGVIMSSSAMLQSLHENLSSRAQVKSVFGEPISAEGKTIIPIAKIAYGFGAGAGTGGVGDTRARGEGGGGGGGVRAVPVGVIEVSSNQPTRFVPITDRKKLGLAAIAGGIVGVWLGWRRRRR
jgi:uncharacterized spore protein YtfJ